MKAGRWILLLLLAGGVAAVAWWLVALRTRPPEVPFARVTRGTIVSSLETNGKVEPIEWAVARAERGGPVVTILVQRGQHVAQGAPLVEQDSREAQAELAADEARIAQFRAELATLEAGGRAVDLANIEGSLASARLELQVAQKNYDALVRLQEKHAATAQEVTAAKDQVEKARVRIQSLEQQKAALATPADKSVTLARLRDAETAAQAARDRIARSTIRAPMAGLVYQFDLKPGAYLNPGDMVASIGRLDRVRVKVFVDEPDLGRVARSMPVTITWDALPGRTWKGVVEKTPTEVVAVGTRQVGEVTCVIENPDRDLLAGTNVNASIRSQVVEGALTIPREALYRQDGSTGVYLLAGDRLAWHNVTLGASSITRIQVEALKEGDAVALPSDRVLKDGMLVRPVYR